MDIKGGVVNANSNHVVKELIAVRKNFKKLTGTTANSITIPLYVYNKLSKFEIGWINKNFEYVEIKED